MDSSPARVVALLLALAVTVTLTGRRLAQADHSGELRAATGDTIEITPELRRGGLRFRVAVEASDRAWILASVGRARPEALRLIGEVDGMVEIQTHYAAGPTVGWTQGRSDGFDIAFNLAALNGPRSQDRDAVVLHELGHVIDAALVPAALRTRLDRGIPRLGPCTTRGDPVGACAPVEERFADTFAKWALGGAVSAAGAGYGVANPPSLEEWGSPLGALATRLPPAP